MSERTNASTTNRAIPSDRTFQALQREAIQVPSRYGRSSTAEQVLRVVIIGGNALASGVQAIQYAASVTPLAVYDPDVDTAFPAGLGNAWLYINRVLQPDRVLVRHAFAGDQLPLVSGRKMAVAGTETLTHSGTDMTAYLVEWL